MGKRGAAAVEGKLPADLVKRFKKEILDKFEADTKMRFVSQYLKEQTESKEIETRQSGTWMTDKQIAKEECLDLNDEEHKQELASLLSGLEQRDHPVKAWADQGKKQYKYFQDTTATERFTWLESACGKEAQPKAKAGTNAIEQNPTNVVVDWSIACKKVVANIDHALEVYGRQEVLFVRPKNDKSLDAAEKGGMQPKMDEVVKLVAIVNDAKANYTEDEAGHGVLKESLRVFGEKLDAAIAENNKVKELKASKKSK